MALSKDQETFLNLIPGDGTTISNGRVFNALGPMGWSKEKFANVRQQLIDAGVLAPWKGQGGTVYRVVDDEQALLQRVPPNGDALSNYTLIKDLASLGWSKDKYWEVRQRLLDKGIIGKGRGPGGSVYRNMTAEDAQDIADAREQESAGPDSQGAYDREKQAESHLYEPAKNTILGVFSKEKGYVNPIVELSADYRVRGKWRNPDIVLLNLRRFPLIHQKILEVVAFEVKRAGDWNVDSIHQASAYGRFANFTYSLFQAEEGDASKRKALVDACISEAIRLGVGLIIATDFSKHETWEERAPARPHLPDPYMMEEFLSYLQQDTHHKLRDFWL